MARKRKFYWFSIMAGTITIVLVIITYKIIAEKPKVIDLTSPQAQQINATLLEAERLRDLVACVPDTEISILAEVFINTSDYKVNDQQRETIRRVLGKQALDNAGYLTVLQAYYLSQRSDIIDTSITQVPGLRPTQRGVIYCPTPMPEPMVIVQSMAIKDNKAIVRYDDGFALQEATLIMINDQWFIAGIKVIWSHYG